MKVILFGCFPGTSSEESLCRGLEKAGAEVIRFDFRKTINEIGQGQCELKMIACAREHQPDLAIFCKLGELTDHPIIKIRDICKTFFWYMDALHHYDKARPKINAAHQSGITLYEVYKKAHDEDDIPHSNFVLDGYDPEWDIPPAIPEVDHEFISSFIGDLYGRRLRYLQEVKCFSVHTGAYRQAHSKLVHMTKINLGFTNSGIWPHNGPSARTYKVLACGGFLLLERFPHADQYPFKEDRDFVGFSTFDELRDKIKYFTRHPDERLAIAVQGYKTIQPYSRYRTIKQMLKISGLGE